MSGVPSVSLRVALALSISAAAQVPGRQPAAQAASPRIVIAPDVLASRDGSFPHVELMIAANPRNPRNLLGGAITYTRPDGGTACKAYTSFDGGLSWIDSTFPEQLATGGADPQVAFTPHGTALFAALNSVRDDEGRNGSALRVSRSDDGGRVWSASVNLGYSYDHPQIVVDQTVGRFAGRIYISVLYGRDYNLGVFRSDDDGRTFVGPVKFIDGAGIGLQVATPLVLSDGTLMVNYFDYPIDPATRQQASESAFWLVTSTDGGVTFSAPTRVGRMARAPDQQTVGARMTTMPLLAIDATSRFRDRAYRLSTEPRGGRMRVMLSYSADRGVTWTEGRIIDTGAPATAHQYQPAIAVNHDGVVGVTWFDTRAAAVEGEYEQYFSASLDGGETFLPARRVSSERSRTFGAANMAVSSTGFRDSAGGLRLPFLSAASRWSQGGDYMGLTADSRGVFHPFWADSRSGSFQAWTTQIVVDTRGTTPRPEVSAAPSRVKASIAKDIELVMDPSRYDVVTNELVLPVRLKNVSMRPIFGPISVAIRSFGSGMGDGRRENAPAVLNASNGQPGAGAVFDYSAALGDLDALAPGAQTGAVVWRFRLKQPTTIPDMHLEITGALETGK